VGVRTRTEIGWQSIHLDRCRKRKQPWRAVLALRSALAGAPFWLYAGGVAPCPEPSGLKAQRPVFRQVLTPRLPSLSLGTAVRSQNRKHHHHDTRKTFLPAPCGVRGFVFPQTARKPNSESPGDVIKFPGRVPPSEGYSNHYIANLHSEAFRDLEGSLCDCVTMGQIAAQCMGNAQCQDELLAFSVFNLSRMLDALKAEYEARWHGERRG
jgi:hypothetical protein